ncbi:MAG TPA: SUMF1/EgtB/PvdO family nonheme iron enzyme [Sedimentisphaerales bacterium]|nr:SUMF1/EgtB/PvdO family nonheme iron enzyme [Sedimentisphaerales bacterium]
MKKRFAIVGILALAGMTSVVLGEKQQECFTNSLGIKFIRIEPGTFMMGCDGGGEGQRGHGDFDEEPRHEVTITQPFYMSEMEVSIDQFRQFRAEYPGYDKFRPYASAISWEEAAAFCEWLSEKEGKPYRLPTEAEWEYACRAGTTTPFSSGNVPPEHETANPWGLKNMHTGVAEWCLDWHGVYPEGPQADPVGPENGWTKVVRGGPLDWTVLDKPYYRRSANRGGLSPNFGPPPLKYQYKQLQNAKLTFNLPRQILEEARHEYAIGRFDDTNVTLSEALNTPFRYTGLRNQWSIRTSGFIPGRHEIGFRVVQAPMPNTAPQPFVPPFVHRCVKQSNHGLEQGPSPEKPYYRTRLLFPDFAGASLVEAWKLGIEQGYGGGHHNSALGVLPNGDLLAAYYNTNFGGERDACVSIMSMRFRRGADEWDMPSSWPDNVDCDDEGPVYWNDNGTLWLFWGSPRQQAGYPFQYVKSTDNGATWSPVNFPLFDKRVGPYAAQPINSAFRDSKGTIYLASDGSHSPITSLLWATRDNGRTWYDTGGRTYGRHSTFIILENDVIMAFGGKQAQIDGFHPINIARDGGRTYEIIPSTLPALGGGTRASLIKLASGRLFYVADMHLGAYRKLTPEQSPPGFVGDGAYAALSDGKGQTWRVRKLVGGNVLDEDGKPVKVGTVSYVTARQSPDGIIHVVTSHNHPDLHFELNEAWILQDAQDTTPPAGTEDGKIISRTVKEYSERYPDDRIKVTWSAGTGNDGRYLLQGTETWYYENGQKQWQAEYDAGRRIGTETYWGADGTKQWQKVYNNDRNYDWTVWGPDGQVKARSRWREKKLMSYKFAGQ